MNIRERLEEQEYEHLSPLASFSRNSKGRRKAETECDIRTVYQRDRDRILHSKAFRRLEDKTQVFLSPKGDHYRNRLTHTLEVSQTSRTVAKALQLNEDLVEAIALGHDLGHTPFGHAGERALNSVADHGFEHCMQSLRVVDVLEKNGKGLNLTWEVRDGIVNHRISGRPATLEGQIVRICDKITYMHHDMDDARRAGILTESDIPITLRMLLGDSMRERLNTLIHDLVQSSLGQERISMSEEMSAGMQQLRDIMFQSVYQNPVAKKEENKAVDMILALYEYYMKHPEAMSEESVDAAHMLGVPVQTAVLDYLSGMTDSYAMYKFKETFMPRSWAVF
ncbi:MAG: deoxyguanosinetriphosphate triphosphohydrolase [Lachnospiraceae bacterium]